MSLLSIITEVTGALSLAQPSMVVGSSDRQVIQLFNLANEAGTELARAHPWQALQEEASFTTVTADAQVAAIPADFDRFVPNSFFNRTTRRPLTGPITARQWQWLKAQPVYASVYLAFRERTGQFLIAPQPPAGQQIYYEYISTNWAMSNPAAPAPSVPQSSFQADSDTAFLDEYLIQLSLKWRFLRAKGLDYAEEMETYERQLEEAMGRDGGSSMLSLAPQPREAPIGPGGLTLIGAGAPAPGGGSFILGQSDLGGPDTLG